QRRRGDHRDPVVLLERVERGRGLLVKRLAYGDGVLRHQQRVAVRLRSRDVIPSDIAAGARLVLDDAGLAQRLSPPLRNLAVEGAGRSAGRKCHHQPDWPIGIGGGALRLRRSNGAERANEEPAAKETAHASPSLLASGSSPG